MRQYDFLDLIHLLPFIVSSLAEAVGLAAVEEVVDPLEAVSFGMLLVELRARRARR